MKKHSIALSSASALISLVSFSGCSTMIAKNPEMMATVADIQTDQMTVTHAAPMSATEIARETLKDLSKDLRFESAGAQLTSTAQTKLEALGRTLAGAPEVRVQIDGYTDSSGNTQINRPLSQRRAKAVAEVLKKSGVAPARIMMRGNSDANPVADNTSPTGRAENRRAEISLN